MKIGACIITYNPDITTLTKGVESLKNQIDKIIIVDNGSKDITELTEFCNGLDSVDLLSLGENKGIAAATNVALREFIKQEYDFVLTSDQDSCYPADYVQNFKINKGILNDDNIAVYTPVFFDENENDYAKIIVDSKIFCKNVPATNDYTDVFQAIASGMIIKVSALQKIGLMDEALFIDWVDLEFCWRVRYFGKRIVCCKNMTIHHRLGDKSKDIGYRKVSLRSCVRNYYITRNAFYLATHTKYLRKISKVVLFFKALRYILGYTFLCDAHMKNLHYTLKGMCDGLHGTLGRIRKL